MEKEILINLLNQGLSTWDIAKATNTNQPNIRYWLNKYNLKTIRSINKITGHKRCPSCNVSKSLDHFYKSKKSSSYCKECIIQHNRKKRLYVKQQIVNYLGGKCTRCGYDKCLAALDIHHLDPSSKNKNYAGNRTNFKKIKNELDSCIILCANCHREEHNLIFIENKIHTLLHVSDLYTAIKV